MVSVGGWPGSGKSTLVQHLVVALSKEGFGVAAFSLDDVYLSAEARQQLAEVVHPLLARRGVPGTHDVSLALATVAKLRNAKDHEEVELPRFDKMSDSPFPRRDWPVFYGRPDFIILDAWFWGALPDPDPMSLPACNETERQLDPDGRWRRWVNDALGNGYPELFALFDRHVQIEVPSWEASIRFRAEQERNLFAARGQTVPPGRLHDLRSFLDRFERVARLPRRLPSRHVFEMNNEHSIVGAKVVRDD
jgi:D-glycerate 3-kinase